jgi:hypothetical protein
MFSFAACRTGISALFSTGYGAKIEPKRGEMTGRIDRKTFGISNLRLEQVDGAPGAQVRVSRI